MKKNDTAINNNTAAVTTPAAPMLLSKALENKVMTGNARVLSRATLDACDVDTLLWRDKIVTLYSAVAACMLTMRADDKTESVQISTDIEALSKFWAAWNEILRFASRGRKTRARAYGTDLQFFAFSVRAFQREPKKEEISMDGSAPAETVRKQVFGFATVSRFRALVEWALGKRFLGETLSDDEEAARKADEARAKLNDQLRKRAKKSACEKTQVPADKTPDKTPDKTAKE